MFGPCLKNAPRRSKNYLRADDIYILTTLDRGKALELWWGQNLITTATAEDNTMYRLTIKTSSLISPKDANEMCMITWPARPELKNRNLTTSVLKDISTELDLCHRHLGHSRETEIRRMLLKVVGHNLNALDSYKITDTRFFCNTSKHHRQTLTLPKYRR